MSSRCKYIFHFEIVVMVMGAASPKSSPGRPTPSPFLKDGEL